MVKHNTKVNTYSLTCGKNMIILVSERVKEPQVKHKSYSLEATKVHIDECYSLGAYISNATI